MSATEPAPPSAADPLADLNPVQREAVTHAEGPLLIVAGAGSGKTRVLTRRIAHLIAERGVSPFEILAITFTNRAADEMRSRVGALVGPVARRMWVSTFHSACVRILRRDAKALGYPSSFSIYDQADAERLTGFVIRDLDLDPRKFPPRVVHAAISAAKNELCDFETYSGRAQGPYERRIAEVYREYQRRLLAAGSMDFDDLLMVTVNLFQAHPDVLDHYQRRFAHVLVDEFQDTNRAQNELVVMIGARHHNVCVVGDGDQSIYRFRGADVRNILEFERAFPETRVVTLEQNYRSTQTILDAANSVIAHNAARRPKALWTETRAGEPIHRYFAEDETDEASWVATEATRLHDAEGHRWGDLAVFYRTNAQSRVLEEQLGRRGIPYKVLGGTRFYDRREVKDVLAYLRVATNPSDEVSLRRILNVPRRGIGDTSAGRLDVWAKAHARSLREALAAAGEVGLSGRALLGATELAAVLDELAALAAPTTDHQGAESISPQVVVERILERTGYRAELEALKGDLEAQGRLENLAELVGAAGDHPSVAEFLEAVSLVSDTDELDDDDTRMVLMTMHTAKGLEFPAVFIIGLE
ncbi:MAG: ATP-dependent helicase, partial [Acidimicrobiales bacterium]